MLVEEAGDDIRVSGSRNSRLADVFNENAVETAYRTGS